MRVTATTATRWGLLGAWLVLFTVVVAVVALGRLGPAFGIEPIIIRSGSMSPEIPVGSLVVVRRSAPEAIHPGAVVTIRMRDGHLLTHRVTRVAQLPDGLFLETKGDANDAPDPVLVPASAVAGVAIEVIPYAGYLLAFLSLPTGMVSASTFLAALLLASWLFEEPRPARAGRPLRSTATTR